MGKPRGLFGFPISGAPGYGAALFLGREGTTARSRLDLSTPKGMHQGYAPVHLWSGLDSAHVRGGVLNCLFLSVCLFQGFRYGMPLAWQIESIFAKFPKCQYGQLFELHIQSRLDLSTPAQRECNQGYAPVHLWNGLDSAHVRGGFLNRLFLLFPQLCTLLIFWILYENSLLCIITLNFSCHL